MHNNIHYISIQLITYLTSTHVSVFYRSRCFILAFSSPRCQIASVKMANMKHKIIIWAANLATQLLTSTTFIQKLTHQRWLQCASWPDIQFTKLRSTCFKIKKKLTHDNSAWCSGATKNLLLFIEKYIIKYLISPNYTFAQQQIS